MLDWKFSSKSHTASFQGPPTLFSVRKGERRWEGGVGGMCLLHNTLLVNSLTRAIVSYHGGSVVLLV